MLAVFDYVSASKEIQAALLTAFFSFAAFCVLRIFAARPILQYSKIHSSHLIPKNEKGQIVSVFTTDYMFINAGRRACESLEFVFNYPPQYFDLFPHVPYKTHINPDDRLVVQIENLNPKEKLFVRLLSTAGEIPDVTNVRFKGGNGREIKVDTQRVVPKYVALIAAFFMFFGILASVYCLIRLLNHFI